MKRLLSTLFFVVAVVGASAKELKVESFELLPLDVKARTSPRTTASGEACALIKVSLPVEDVQFWGQIVASEFDVNEYLVYVVPGTEYILVECPGFSPLKVATLVDGKGVAGKSTYRLKVSGFDVNFATLSKDLGGNFLALDISPKDAKNVSVKVDGTMKALDESGLLEEFLPYGQHTYSVEAPGYEPSTGTFQIKRSAETKVDVALRSNSSDITILSWTKDSQIRINGKKKGTDKWKGTLLSGTYLIQVTHPSLATFSSVLTVAESTDTLINIPPLEPVHGSLLIGVKPAGAMVTLDGNIIGQTPLKLDNVSIGEHEISISYEGYQPLDETIVVNGGDHHILTQSLVSKQASVASASDASHQGKSVIPVALLSDTYMRNYVEGLANGHEYVDLGLPSGLTWATCNVGASTPTDGGKLYRWAEITPYPKNGNKNYTAVNTSPDGEVNVLMDDVAYNIGTPSGITGNSFVDVASADWGNGWRIPTIKDWEELLQYCQWTYIAINEIDGYFIHGPNGNAIFLPIVYIKHRNDIQDKQLYWSATPLLPEEKSTDKRSGTEGDTHCISCGIGETDRSTLVFRDYLGAPIRPVR